MKHQFHDVAIDSPDIDMPFEGEEEDYTHPSFNTNETTEVGSGECAKRETVTFQPGLHVLKVQGFPQGTGKQMVELFFSNARQSGGGCIKELDFCQEEDYALIQFKNNKGKVSSWFIIHGAGSEMCKGASLLAFLR